MFTAHIGDDLELRLLEERHAQALFEVIDRDREDLRTWLPWVDGSRSAEDIAGFIRSVRQEFADDHDLTCGIWHHGHPVGTIGLRLNPPDRAAEIGYWLARDARGQGIMTRATRALITYAFDELGLHRIVVRCAPCNRASSPSPNAWDSPWRAPYARRSGSTTTSAISPCTPSCATNGIARSKAVTGLQCQRRDRQAPRRVWSSLDLQAR